MLKKLLENKWRISVLQTWIAHTGLWIPHDDSLEQGENSTRLELIWVSNKVLIYITCFKPCDQMTIQNQNPHLSYSTTLVTFSWVCTLLMTHKMSHNSILIVVISFIATVQIQGFVKLVMA